MEVTKTVLSLMLVVITILTTLTTTIAAVYAGGDDDDDGKKNKAEDDSAAAIADCDRNEVERAGFDCIAQHITAYYIFSNDVEIETPEESATLSVCKTTNSADNPPEDFAFTVEGNDPSPAQFRGSPNCVDVTIGPGEYAVSEFNTGPAGENHLTSVEGDCVQDPNIAQRAIGEIQAGQTQRCVFINEIVL